MDLGGGRRYIVVLCASLWPRIGRDVRWTMDSPPPPSQRQSPQHQTDPNPRLGHDDDLNPGPIDPVPMRA